MNKGFDREVGAWNGLYESGTSQNKRYAIFQKNARQRTLKRMSLCLSLLDIRPGMKILDLGCGSGMFGQEIANKSAYWYGADLSFNMLNHGRKNSRENSVGRKAWINGSAVCIPFKNSVFDAVACIGVLNFFKKEMVRDSLSEIARVVKPGGIVVFTSLRLDVLTWLRSRMYPNIPLPISSPGPLYPMHYKKMLGLLDTEQFECMNMINVEKYLYLPHYTIFKLLKK